MSEGAVPILPARDLTETRAFFERLGFETTGWWPNTFGGYAILGRGSLQMHFFLFAELPPSESYAQCYWYVDDVDAVYRMVARTGVAVNPPEDKPWGMRECHFAAPNGTLIRIGEPLRAR